MGLDDVQDFAKAITVAGAALASAVGAVKLVIAALAKAKLAWQRPARLEATMNAIIHELRPNGSSSLRDAVDRMEARQIFGEQIRAMSLNAQGFGVFYTDEAGHCTEVNRTYQRLTGRTIEELLGLGWVNVIHPEDLNAAAENWNAAVDDQREYQGEYRYVRPDKSTIVVQCTAYPTKDRHGAVTGYVGFVKEIGRG